MQRTITNPALKDTVTFLQTARESGGAITDLAIEVMPGGSNPAHYHRTYDETISVLEGVLQLKLARDTHLILLPGESYVIKAGQVHRLQNTADIPLHLRCQIVPGNEGFEDSLRIMYGLASDGLYSHRQMPRNFEHLAVCAVMSDTRLPGLLSVVNLVLRLVARLAQWRGVEQQLRRTYCESKE